MLYMEQNNNHAQRSVLSIFGGYDFEITTPTVYSVQSPLKGKVDYFSKTVLQRRNKTYIASLSFFIFGCSNECTFS
jgi:hypothetical protein